MNIRLQYGLLFFCIFSFNLHVYSKTGKDTITVVNTSTLKSTSNIKVLHDLDEKFPVKDFKYTTTFSKPEFSFENIKSEYVVNDAILKDRDEALASFDEIESGDKWVSTLTNDDVRTLPVGIKHDVNGVEYAIGITTAKIGPQHTELNVFARMILPQTDEKGEPIELFFGANNVKLSHQGGIVGEANLVLLGDIFIPFNGGSWLLSLKGGFDYKTGIAENLTYVTIDCDGVKEMGLQGEVQLSRNMVLPIDEQGKPLPDTRAYKKDDGSTIQIPNRVSGAFSVLASDWNNMIVDISISPFVLAEHPDKFNFSVNNAVFDFSDLRTENVTFPQYYYDNNLLLPNEDSWRGVYIQSLEVAMPKEFKTKESISENRRVSFKAMDMIIDSYGVSGRFSAENIIPLESGRTAESKSWAFSVDKIGIEIAANHFVEGNFDGRILLPLSEKGKTSDENKNLGLGYKGLISEEEYSLAVSTLDTVSFDVFSAKAELLPNSGVELTVIEDSFRPKAILNGRMAISASQRESLENEGQKDENDDTVQFKGIEFQNMVLQTESPLIAVDYFGYKDEVKLANFPVSIANIAFMSNESEAGLEFDLKVNLMGSDDKGFAADARLGIFGRYTEEQYEQRWKYDRLDLSKISLEANLGAIQLKGSLLLMDNDPIYGDGFSADIEGTFGNFGPITCKTIFGRSEFRYWYVDGAIHGLKIQLGPFQISGFAGGAFYKMTRRPNAGPDFSPSGLSYIPNEDTGLGVKAMVLGAIGDESTIAVGAGFEIEFNRHGGVNRIGLFGEAQVMKAFDFPNPVAKMSDKLSSVVTNQLGDELVGKLGKNLMDKATDEYEPEIVGEGMLSAKMAMEFDFVNKSFHATIDIYVSIFGILEGRASGGRAGWGVVHFDQEKWYTYMGTPTDRLGLKLSLGPLKMEAGGYFMVGDEIPGSPPPPAIVAEILGVDVKALDYMRDENALGTGKGFAFGHDFSVDTGNISFLLFYARFQAGGGFDIMLKNYGDAECSNTGGQVGINGWYANGQGYAYLQGELGIKIKLFFKKKKISIFKGGAAVLLQTKAPNPIWMQGYVGGRFSVLGGLVKGKFRFKITLGKECKFVDDTVLGGIKVIGEIKPNENEKEVDVFATPQVAFNMKVNTPFVIPEDDGDKTYKILLEEYTISDSSGKLIEGDLEWNSSNDRITFISDDVLPPQSELKLKVTVSFQEKVNGSFNTVIFDGEKAIEFKEVAFTTGEAPTVIPLNNIVYAYPVLEQKYFYKEEYKSGYIQLQRGQDYLFDNTHWESQVKMVSTSGIEKIAKINYQTSDNKVYYTLPNVQTSENYILKIVSTPKGYKGSKNDPMSSTEITNLDAENTVEINTNKAENISKEGELERLTYNFSTSEHKTFVSKIRKLSIKNDVWGKVSSEVIYLETLTKPYEGFDVAELKGTRYSENQPLVVVEATLNDNYFKEDIDPIIYQKYPQESRYTLSRDANILGFRPVRAVPLINRYITSIEYNVKSNIATTEFPFMYDLPNAYKNDHMDLRNKVINAYDRGRIAWGDSALDILDNDYVFIPKGKYTVKLSYMLPGGIRGSTAEHDYTNPITLYKE